MLLARVRVAARDGRDRVCALGLLLVLVALLPLAYASPPDPLWIAGIYDDADFDEVVVAVVSASGVVGETVSVLGKPVDILAAAVPLHRTVFGSVATQSAFSIRAPPA